MLFTSMPIDSDIDGSLSMMVFGEGIALTEALESLELTEEARKEGHWWKKKIGNVTRVSVRVGCHCVHDCCGHLCGLTYDFTMLAGRLVAIEERLLNV